MNRCKGVFPEKQRRWSELEDKLTYPVKSPIVLGVLSLVNLFTGSEKKKNQRLDSLPLQGIKVKTMPQWYIDK